MSADTVKQNTIKKKGLPKGHTNNPNGRPRVEDSLAGCVRKFLSEKVKGKERNERFLERLNEIVETGKDKDAVAAISLLWDRAYGKASQPITGEGGGPIEILYVNTFTGV